MPDIKKIKLSDTMYDICDANAVHIVNLLDEPIVISNFDSSNGNTILLDRPLGLAIGGTYTLNYTYKGVTKDVALIGCSQTQAGVGDEEDGVVVPQEIVGRGTSFLTDDNGSPSGTSGSLAVLILDKCQVTDDGIAYNENSASIIIAPVTAENYESSLTINSITNSVATAEMATIMQNMRSMQNMLVARSSSKFDSLISSENVGKAISYNKDLYIIDKGAKEIEVGDSLTTLYFDTSTEPNLAALSYDEDGLSVAL